MYREDKTSGEPQHPSIEGFTAFVASKEPSETYDWVFQDICACGQYAKAHGLMDDWRDDDTSNSIWAELNALARPNGGGVFAEAMTRGTFGELHKRLLERV